MSVEPQYYAKNQGGVGKKAWKAGPDPYIFSAESKQAAEQLRDDHANNIENYEWLEKYREDPLMFIIIEDETNSKLFGQTFHSSDVTARTTYFGRTSPFGTPAKPNVALTGGTDPELGKKIYQLQNQRTRNAFNTIASDFDHFKRTNNFLHLTHGDEEDEVEDIFVFTRRSYQEIWGESIGGETIPTDPKTQYANTRWSRGNVTGNVFERGAGGNGQASNRIDRTVRAFQNADQDTHPWTLTVTDSNGDEHTVNIQNIEKRVIDGDEFRYKVTFTQPTGGDVAEGQVSTWTIRALLPTGRYDLVLVMGDSDDDSIEVAASVAANDWDMNTLDYSHNWKELGGGDDGGFRLGPAPNRFDSVEDRDTQAQDRRNVESWLDIYDEDETQVVRVIEGLTMRLNALKEYSEVDETVFGDDITDVRGEAIYTTGGGTVYNVDFEGAGAADAATALKTLIEGKPVHDRLVFKSGSAEAELDALTITTLRSRQTIFGRTVGSATAPAKPAVAGVDLYANGRQAEVISSSSAALLAAINATDGAGATPLQLSLTISGTTHIYTITSAVTGSATRGTYVLMDLTRTSGGTAPATNVAPTDYDITGLFPGTDRRVSFGFVGADESPFQAVPTANNWDIVDRNIEATWFDIGGASGEGDSRGELLFTSSSLVGTGDPATPGDPRPVLGSGDDLTNTWTRDTSLPGFGWSATSATVSFPELRPADNTIGAWIVVEDADGNETDEMMIPWGPSLQEGGATRQLRCAANIRIMVQFVQEGTRTAVWLEAREGDCTGYRVKIYLARMSGRDGRDGSGEDNVQADWNEANSGNDAFIRNKPTIPNNAAIDARIGGRFRANSPSGLEDGSFLRMTASGFDNVTLAALKTLIGSTTSSGGSSGIETYTTSKTFSNTESAALDGKILLGKPSGSAIQFAFGDPGSNAVQFVVFNTATEPGRNIQLIVSSAATGVTIADNLSISSGGYAIVHYDPSTDSYLVKVIEITDQIVRIDSARRYTGADVAETFHNKLIYAEPGSTENLQLQLPDPGSSDISFLIAHSGVQTRSVELQYDDLSTDTTFLTLDSGEMAKVDWDHANTQYVATKIGGGSGGGEDNVETYTASKTFSNTESQDLNGKIIMANPEAGDITLTFGTPGSGASQFVVFNTANAGDTVQLREGSGVLMDDLDLDGGEYAVITRADDSGWYNNKGATGGGVDNSVKVNASKTYTPSESEDLDGKIVFADSGDSTITLRFNNAGSVAADVIVINNTSGTGKVQLRATGSGVTIDETGLNPGESVSMHFDPSTDKWGVKRIARTQVTAAEIRAGSVTGTRSFSPKDIHDMIDRHAPNSASGMIERHDATKTFSVAESQSLDGRVLIAAPVASDITLSLADPGSTPTSFVAFNNSDDSNDVIINSISSVAFSGNSITLSPGEFARVTWDDSESEWKATKFPLTRPAQVSSSERSANSVVSTTELRSFSPSDIVNMVETHGAKERVDEDKTYTNAEAENLNGNVMICAPTSDITITLPDYGSGTIPINFVAFNNGPSRVLFDVGAGTDLTLASGEIGMLQWDRTDEEWETQKVTTGTTTSTDSSVVEQRGNKTFNATETRDLAGKILLFTGAGDIDINLTAASGSGDMGFMVVNAKDSGTVSFDIDGSGTFNPKSDLGLSQFGRILWDDSTDNYAMYLMPFRVDSDEITAGNETAVRQFSPKDIHDLIDAHAPAAGTGVDNFLKYNSNQTFTTTQSAELDKKVVLVDAGDSTITLNLNDAGTVAASALFINTTVGTGSVRLRATGAGITIDNITANAGEAVSAKFDTTANKWETQRIERTQVTSTEISGGTVTGTRAFSPADIKAMIDAHGNDVSFLKYDSSQTFTATQSADLDGKVVLVDAANSALSISLNDAGTVEAAAVFVNTTTGTGSVQLNATGSGVTIDSIGLLGGESATAKFNTSTNKWETQYIERRQVTSSERTAGTATATRAFSPADIKSMIDTHGDDTERQDSDKTYSVAETQQLNGRVIICNPSSAMSLELNDPGSTAVSVVVFNTGTANVTITGATSVSASNQVVRPNEVANAKWNDGNSAWDTNIVIPQVSGTERTAGTLTQRRSFSPADIKSMIDTHAAGGGSASSAISAYTASETFDASDTAALQNKILFYVGNGNATFTFSDPGGSSDFGFVVFNMSPDRNAELSLTTSASVNRELATTIVGSGSAATAVWDDSESRGAGRFEFHETGRIRVVTSSLSMSAPETQQLHGMMLICMNESNINITMSNPDRDEAFVVINASPNGSDVTLTTATTASRTRTLTLTDRAHMATCSFDRSAGSGGIWRFDGNWEAATGGGQHETVVVNVTADTTYELEDYWDDWKNKIVQFTTTAGSNPIITIEPNAADSWSPASSDKGDHIIFHPLWEGGRIRLKNFSFARHNSDGRVEGFDKDTTGINATEGHGEPFRLIYNDYYETEVSNTGSISSTLRAWHVAPMVQDVRNVIDEFNKSVAHLDDLNAVEGKVDLLVSSGQSTITNSYWPTFDVPTASGWQAYEYYLTIPSGRTAKMEIEKGSHQVFVRQYNSSNELVSEIDLLRMFKDVGAWGERDEILEGTMAVYLEPTIASGTVTNASLSCVADVTSGRLRSPCPIDVEETLSASVIMRAYGKKGTANPLVNKNRISAATTVAAAANTLYIFGSSTDLATINTMLTESGSIRSDARVQLLANDGNHEELTIAGIAGALNGPTFNSLLSRRSLTFSAPSADIIPDYGQSLRLFRLTTEPATWAQEGNTDLIPLSKFESTGGESVELHDTGTTEFNITTSFQKFGTFTIPAEGLLWGFYGDKDSGDDVNRGGEFTIPCALIRTLNPVTTSTSPTAGTDQAKQARQRTFAVREGNNWLELIVARNEDNNVMLATSDSTFAALDALPLEIWHVPTGVTVNAETDVKGAFIASSNFTIPATGDLTGTPTWTLSGDRPLQTVYVLNSSSTNLMLHNKRRVDNHVGYLFQATNSDDDIIAEAVVSLNAGSNTDNVYAYLDIIDGNNRANLRLLYDVGGESTSFPSAHVWINTHVEDRSTSFPATTITVKAFELITPGAVSQALQESSGSGGFTTLQEQEFLRQALSGTDVALNGANGYTIDSEATHARVTITAPSNLSTGMTLYYVDPDDDSDQIVYDSDGQVTIAAGAEVEHRFNSGFFHEESNEQRLKLKVKPSDGSTALSGDDLSIDLEHETDVNSASLEPVTLESNAVSVAVQASSVSNSETLAGISPTLIDFDEYVPYDDVTSITISVINTNPGANVNSYVTLSATKAEMEWIEEYDGFSKSTGRINGWYGSGYTSVRSSVSFGEWRRKPTSAHVNITYRAQTAVPTILMGYVKTGRYLSGLQVAAIGGGMTIGNISCMRKI